MYCTVPTHSAHQTGFNDGEMSNLSHRSNDASEMSCPEQVIRHFNIKKASLLRRAALKGIHILIMKLDYYLTEIQ